MAMTIEFPHKAPEGYYYEQTDFKRNVIAIWIHHQRRFDYNLGDPVRCIWGFYNTKKRTYHSPINSGTVGNIVSVENTTPYSAMIPKQTPLESAFV
jgi:ribosomal protein S17